MDAQLCDRSLRGSRGRDRSAARHLRRHRASCGRRLNGRALIRLRSVPDRIEAITNIDQNYLSSPAPRVLAIVEDDPDMRLLIRITLESDEMEIVGEAATAAEAIRLAKELQPSLIILDHVIDGPVMGLEAARFIKEACPTAKILMFSAHPVDWEASVETAVDAFVSKVDFESLVPTARRLLDRG